MKKLYLGLCFSLLLFSSFCLIPNLSNAQDSWWDNGSGGSNHDPVKDHFTVKYLAALGVVQIRCFAYDPGYFDHNTLSAKGVSLYYNSDQALCYYYYDFDGTNYFIPYIIFPPNTVTDEGTVVGYHGHGYDQIIYVHLTNDLLKTITSIKVNIHLDGSGSHKDDDNNGTKSITLPQFGGLKITGYTYQEDGTVKLDWSSNSNDLTNFCNVFLYQTNPVNTLANAFGTSGSFTVNQSNEARSYYLYQEHFANSSLNAKSGEFSVPAFTHPTGIKAQYNSQTNKVDLTWTIPKASGNKIEDCDFKLQRATKADFSDAVDVNIKGRQSTKYDPNKTTYTYSDDPHAHAYYRIARDLNDSWGWQFAKSTEIVSAHAAITKNSNVSLVLSDEKIEDTLRWDPAGIWTHGAQFIITRFNRSNTSSTEIKLNGEDYYKGIYVDSLIIPCNEYYYTLQVIPADGLGFDTEKPFTTKHSVLPIRIGTVKNLTVSKGYFPDRTTLRWTSEGAFDNYIIKRKVYGSSDSDYVQIATAPGANISNIQAEDDKGTPGVYYQYMIVGAVGCNHKTRYSQDSLYGIGFRAPTGNIYGRVTYENGQAVEDVAVRLESQDNTKLGKSLYLDGSDSSYLKVNSLNTPFSDSAFTVEAWIKPNDATPKNQVIFSRGNQYELGFDAAGKLYFSYNGDTAAGPYKNKNQSFVHIAAIHSPDSLKIMLNDTVIVRKAIPYAASNHASHEVFIGRNTNGHNFTGYIDEMRIWNKALSDSVIRKDYTRLLTGGEKGLVAYWRFDETISDQFYDISHHGDQYNMNDGMMNGQYVNHTDTIPTFSQLSLKAYTDSTGSYMISGVPYTGVNGTTYKIVPKLGTHQFDPVAVNRLVSVHSSSFTVDFTDNSSFPVSGTVFYRNSTIPVDGVQFKIDGHYAQKSNGEIIETDAAGQFTISVPVGTHEVKAVKAHHVFVDGGKITDRHGDDLNYQGPISERRLYDSTTVRFIGRVAGGAVQESYPLGHSLSKNNLGKNLLITLTLPVVGKYKINASALTPDSIVTVDHLLPSSQTDSSKLHHTRIEFKQDTIYIHPDSVTGEFAVDLIPEKFNILHANATGWKDVLEGKAISMDLTDELIPKYSIYTDTLHNSPVTSKDTTYIDSVAYNYAYSFIKRVTPSVSISQTGSSGELSYFGDTVYVYHSKAGDTTRIPVVDKSKSGKAQYLFGYPVFTQNKNYEFKIKAFEEYPFYESVKQDGTPVAKEQDGKPVIDKVPTSDGEVSIYNNIQNGATQAVVLHLDSATGEVKYNFFAGDPVLAKPGTKDFAASIRFGKATDVSWKWLGAPQMRGYVMGGKSSGQNFVTAGPNKILMVLRDPPGNRSYSFVEGGSTISSSSTYTGTVDQIGDEQTKNEVTVDAITWQGVGAGTITEITSGGGMDIGVHHEEHFTGTNTTNHRTTITTRFQTSDDPAFVGARGDVYVGHSTNTTYGPSNNLIIIKREDKKNTDSLIYDPSPSSPYIIVKREGLVFGQYFGTLFAYPQQYIVKKLIPNLINLRNSFLLPKSTSAAKAQQIANNTKMQVYVSKLDNDDPDFGKTNEIKNGIFDGDGASYKIYFPDGKDYTTDTIKILNQYIEGWENTIADNEKDKINSTLIQNYSFHSGNPVSYSRSVINYSKDTTYSFNIILSASVMSTSFADLPGVGFEFKYKESLGTQQGGTFKQSGDSTTTMGFVLAADGVDEYLSVNVNQDEDSSFVFLTQGGITGCPYEGATKTLYYQPGTAIDQPSLQIEVPKLKIDNPVVNNIPSTQKASYTLYLSNESEAKLPATFVLSYANTDSVKGAFIAVDGSSIAGGRAFVVQYGETVEKVLTLTKGPDAMDYNNIPIILHSSCQYDPTGYLDLIADTVLISAHFVPSCSNINIKAPLAQWILNTGSPANAQGKRYIPVTLNNFDLTNKLFDHIELQYKPGASSTWITAMKFYDDSAKFEAAQGGKQFITNAQGINYNLEMDEASFNDQKYDLRALAVCNLGPGNEITTPSNIISGLKDTYNPRLFGSPQPANGILGIEDEIRLNFNEPIAAGLLTHANFQVTGIRNGSQGDHSVSVRLDGKGDYLATEFDKNLTGKDITAEMWVLPGKQENETIFSQGNLNNSMELAFTEDNHLEVIIGQKAVKSDNPLDYKKGEWAHVALVYHAETGKVSAFYNFDEVIHDAPVGSYTGIGHFEFGRSISRQGNYFAGKMHEARVWSKVLSETRLQVNSLTRLSGAENSLLAYYPMNEGKGDIAFDKAHGSNAKMTGNWSLPPGRAIQFEGNGYLKLNTSYAPITSDMDYTLGLWFKGAPGQTDAAFASNGKGDGTDPPPGGSKNLFFLGIEDSKLTFENNGFKVQLDSNYLDNNWHQVAIAVNRISGVAQIFVDGLLKKYFDAQNLGGIASAYTYLGARAWYDKDNAVTPHIDRYFNGEIDEFRIWNTYLNKTLINKNNNVRLKGDELGLMAYYPFEKYYVFQNNKELDSTLSDMKIQDDPNVHVPGAFAVNAKISDDMAPVKDRGPVDNLQFDYVVNNDALIINMLEPRQAIDKTIVTLQAENVRDKNGNAIVSPITWTAYIDQNQLKWGDEELNFSKDIYKPLQFESYVVNNGGSIQHFRLDNLPPWLTAFPSSGTVDPEGKQKIIFTVNKGLNVGTYDEIIYMLNDNDESEALALNVKVIGNTPSWKVNPADFQYNMSLYGKIRIDGIFSDDKEDMLAAFINGKCVGVTHNAFYDNTGLWYALLTLYSDSIQYNDVEFRIWDASTGKVYAGLPSSPVSFSNNAIIGTPREPVIFDGKELLFQNIKLNKGWNWLSFSLVNSHLNNVNTTLANGDWQSGDIVKHDERGFDQYSNHNGWVGTLSKFDNTSLFKLKTGKAQTLSTNGTLIDVKQTPISVRGNRWSYISYLPQANMTLKEALADYDASDGDVIKSQTGFAMYDARSGWVGNLTFLEPGQGYMIFRKTNSDVTFVYPSISGSLDIHRLTGNNDDIKRLNPYQIPVANNFNYADNMTMIAAIGKGFKLQPDDKILAYTGNDLRGKAMAIYDPLINNSSFFFNISGEKQQPVYFSIERKGEIVAKTKPVVSYFANSRIGSLKEPFMLHFKKVNTGTTANEVTVYPNPFHNKVNIFVNLKTSATTASHNVQMSVWNMAGQQVFKASKKQINNGHYHTTWNGKTAGGKDCTVGVYFIHILVDDESYVYKVLKY